MRPIQVYRISDREMWVQEKTKENWYHYLGEYGDIELTLQNQYTQKEIPISIEQLGEGFFYYYGKAWHKEEEHVYFVQNTPSVTYNKIPDIKRMQMPFTLQALDYDQTFHYPNDIKQFLSALPACYVDRYKRPIKKAYGRTYPIAMEQVKTTWKDLPETTYPIVVDFRKTPFGVADLEPEHTTEDLEHFHSLPGYYEEETPRGGKHKLVRIEDGTFKFRYSPGLEFIHESQVTLYGIHGKWLCDNPPALDISNYQKIGHTEHTITARLERPDVSKEVRLLKEKAIQNVSSGISIAETLYQRDTDISHGEYVALRTLYEQDIAPYANQFDSGLLPWILESYATDVIPHREKHETMRNELPYLVYLAGIIIEKKSHIWRG